MKFQFHFASDRLTKFNVRIFPVTFIWLRRKLTSSRRVSGSRPEREREFLISIISDETIYTYTYISRPITYRFRAVWGLYFRHLADKLDPPRPPSISVRQRCTALTQESYSHPRRFLSSSRDRSGFARAPGMPWMERDEIDGLNPFICDVD